MSNVVKSKNERVKEFYNAMFYQHCKIFNFQYKKQLLKFEIKSTTFCES